MRLFFMGPRIMGLRPGISFGPEDFRRLSRSREESAGASRATGSFVYVIRGAGNRHKIGVSADPIQRIKDLQTGSPEPLDFAYIAATPGMGFNIENAAHDLLDAHRQTGEWFAVPASIAIGSVIEVAQRLGEPIQQVTPQMVPQIIRIANRSSASGPSRVVRIMTRMLVALTIIFVVLVAVVELWPDPPSSTLQAGENSVQRPSHQ